MTRKSGKPTRSSSSSPRKSGPSSGSSKRGPARTAGNKRRTDDDKPFRPKGDKEFSARPERSGRGPGRPSSGGPKKSYSRESSEEGKPYRSSSGTSSGSYDRKKTYGKSERSEQSGSGRSPRTGGYGDDRKKSYGKSERTEQSGPARAPRTGSYGDDRKKTYSRTERSDTGRPPRTGGFGEDKRKSYGRKEGSDESSSYRSPGRASGSRDGARTGTGRYERKDESASPRSYSRGGSYGQDKPYRKTGTDEFGRKSPYKGKYDRRRKETEKTTSDDGTVRLNKYLSNAGVASRREADEFISLGLVKVNGVVVTELGHKIDPATDKVQFDGQFINREKLKYVLLNKPKDYITTMEDERGRRTVMNLVRGICKERIYPVGRLDRQTTGLLLFTNDGDLAKRLMHPKHGFPKIYHVELLEKVSTEHLQAMRDGFELDDGFIKVDEVSFVGDGKDKHQVGLRIHSGRNRIVRRIFEHLGYNIKKLDRVVFAGLTKKDLPRGRARLLTEQEIQFLKMIR